MGLPQILGDRDFFNIFSTWRIPRQISRQISWQNSEMTNTTKYFSQIGRVWDKILYWTKSSPLFRQQNIQRSRNMVHSHFTLCLKIRDYLKRLLQHPWYGLLWSIANFVYVINESWISDNNQKRWYFIHNLLYILLHAQILYGFVVETVGDQWTPCPPLLYLSGINDLMKYLGCYTKIYV